jgi:hypothetical protein
MSFEVSPIETPETLPSNKGFIPLGNTPLIAPMIVTFEPRWNIHVSFRYRRSRVCWPCPFPCFCFPAAGHFDWRRNFCLHQTGHGFHEGPASAFGYSEMDFCYCSHSLIYDHLRLRFARIQDPYSSSGDGAGMSPWTGALPSLLVKVGSVAATLLASPSDSSFVFSLTLSGQLSSLCPILPQQKHRHCFISKGFPILTVPNSESLSPRVSRDQY